MGMRLILFFSILLMISCSKKSDESPAPSRPTNSTATWTFKGVFGGYIPSITFHPSNACEVWASGDDMSGLYKSTDCGATWSLVTTPKNFSTYSLFFDPTDSLKMYAVSHFGWGMMKSADGGSNWTLAQSGLPSTGTAKHVYQTAINPIASTNIIAGTDDGLYRSTDSGANFRKLVVAWGSVFRAVVYSTTGRLFAGATNGVVKYSDDNGNSWSDLVTGSVALSKLEISTNALYILFADATLMYVSLPGFGSSGTINNPASAITTGLQTSLAIYSGGSQATDTLFIGTSKNDSVSSTRWGLFKSSNGGSSWTQMGSGLSRQSIFSVAVNPLNANNILIGSTNSSGVFRTIDGGSNWVSSSTGIKANSVLGFGQNPLNSSELVMSSTVGLGLGQSYSSMDSGSSWSVISEVNSSDGVVAWNFDPENSGVVLAGMVSKGLYRSTTGVGGSWKRIISTDTKVDRIYRDNSNSAIIYALARTGSVSADIRIYYSSNGGASFTKRTSFFANDLSTHPSNLNEGIMVSTSDGFVSTDGFATGTSLGLSSQATSESGLSTVAFNPNNSSEVWVGGVAGGLYQTTNYVNSGGGITWQSRTSPISNAMVQNILIRNEAGAKVIYVSSFGGDVYFTSGAVLGLWKSSDNGITWTNLSNSLYPCTSFWGIYPDQGSSTDIWGAMWGGGLFKLSYQ